MLIMLKYIVIPLAENAVSYCHYNKTGEEANTISEDVLQKTIRYAMLENLHATFVFPNQSIPENYLAIINTISHTKIAPINSPLASIANIIVAEGLAELDCSKISNNQILVLRISCGEIGCITQIYNNLKGTVARINIIITDIDKSNDKIYDEYKSILSELQLKVSEELQENNHTQINLLSDRLYLTGMNNCNAGYESMALMPNGKFYPCPGFYYDNPDEDFGDIEQGVSVKNQQLYRLDHAPICSHCDAYQCRRCVWQNRRTTLEVNTPSKEQCVWSHIERNVSGNILSSIRKNMGEMALQPVSIPEINYLDPFDNRDEWI